MPENSGPLRGTSGATTEVGMPRLRACQVCGRVLTPLKDGTARRHGRGGACEGSGYRLDLWPVGQRLRHYAGSVWEVVEHRRWEGPSHQWMTDYVMRCLSDPYDSFGKQYAGRVRVLHGEYLHRHGWTPDLMATLEASLSSAPVRT